MTATAAEPLTELLVVDLDVHVHEMPGDLAPYADMPWRVALENTAGASENYLDIPGFSPGTTAYHAQFPTAHEKTRMVHTSEQMRAELDDIHVDLAVLFPDNLLKLPVIAQHDYAAALARAYNAWLVDTWTSQADGLLGAIVACPQDPADAANEIRRYASHPEIVAIFLPCAGVDPLYGHRMYEPIWEAASEADLAILMHSVGVVHPVFPFQTHGFDTHFGRQAIIHSFSIMVNLIQMLAKGVLVRYPDLRFCTTEIGISWLPFLMGRLDKQYVEWRQEVPFMDRRPSEYLKDVWVATQPIEEPQRMSDVTKTIELYDGFDRTVFASDWPHHDFDHPMKIDQIPLSPDDRRKIFGLNALDLLKIDEQGRRV